VILIIHRGQRTELVLSIPSQEELENPQRQKRGNVIVKDPKKKLGDFITNTILMLLLIARFN